MKYPKDTQLLNKIPIRAATYPVILEKRNRDFSKIYIAQILLCHTAQVTTHMGNHGAAASGEAPVSRFA